MWTCVGWFVWYQVQTSKVGGDKNRGTDLSFGQILALGTWVPVFVEFSYIWREGPLAALSGQLMVPCKVVRDRAE